MKKQLSKCAQQGLVCLLCALAAGSAACMIFFDYAGISKKFPSLQSSWAPALQGRVPIPPLWFLCGWLCAGVLVLCGYGIYRLKTQKKRYGMLALSLFLAFWVNVLCLPGSGLLVCMTLIVGGLFALANIPPALGRAIAQSLAAGNSEQEDALAFARRQLRRMEWVRFFPLKRALAACVWLVCLALAVMGLTAFYRQAEADLLVTALLLLAAAVLTAPKVWRYAAAPCHCVPVLNKALSRQEIEQLLQKEKFERFLFEDADLQKGMPVLVSENWMFAEGALISRKLLLRGSVLSNTVTSGGINRRASRLAFLYLNGAQFKTRKTALYLGQGQRCAEMKKALAQIAGLSLSASCTAADAEKKYDAVLPEIRDPKEKLRYLLSHDIEKIRQEYMAAFPPKTEPNKNGKKQKAGRGKA